MPPMIIIKGIVAPSKWDTEGNVIDTKIMTFNEDQFHVDNTELGRLLVHHIRQIVTAKGEIYGKETRKKIRIHRLTIHDANQD